MPTYTIFTAKPDLTRDGFLDKWPDGVENIQRTRLGKRVDLAAASLPVEVQMSADIGGIEFRDLVGNTMGMYVVSERLKDVLLEHADAEFELIPLRIINRKGRAEADTFWIANLLDRQVACADVAKSDMDEMRMKKGRFKNIRRLVLRDAALDPSFKIFRLGEMPKLFLVREDLRDAIEAAGVSGCAFHDIGAPVDIY